MSFVTMHHALAEGDAHALFPELSVVETLCAVETDEGATVPIGSRGTVVGIWGDGQAYEIEFMRPVSGVVTMRADMLRAA